MLIRLEKILRRTALGAFLECLFLQRRIKVAQPTAPRGNVVFFAPTKQRFLLAGYGSITPYFSGFCAQLRSNGYATKYSTTNLGLARSLISRRPSLVILVKTSTDRAKRSQIRDWLLAKAQVVFNDFDTQRLMEDKMLLNSAMDDGDILVPEFTTAVRKSGPFSASPGTAQETQVGFCMNTTPLQKPISRLNLLTPAYKFQAGLFSR